MFDFIRKVQKIVNLGDIINCGIRWGFSWNSFVIIFMTNNSFLPFLSNLSGTISVPLGHFLRMQHRTFLSKHTSYFIYYFCINATVLVTFFFHYRLLKQIFLMPLGSDTPEIAKIPVLWFWPNWDKHVSFILNQQTKRVRERKKACDFNMLK